MKKVASHFYIFTLLFTFMTSAHSAIIQGSEAQPNEYTEVFSFTSPEGFCTATLIAPKTLLTSAHCLPEPGSPDLLKISNKLRAISILRHPNYSDDRGELERATFDVGLITLKDSPTGVTPAELASLENPTDLDSAFKDGLIVVGFGGTRTIHEDSTTGKKRWAETRALESTYTLFTTEGPTSGISYGDQGGPAFLKTNTGKKRILGIASTLPDGGKKLINGVPITSIYTGIRTDLMTWIEKNLKNELKTQ